MVWLGLVLCGVVWCGEVWVGLDCGVVWYGVVGGVVFGVVFGLWWSGVGLSWDGWMGSCVSLQFLPLSVHTDKRSVYVPRSTACRVNVWAATQCVIII